MELERHPEYAVYRRDRELVEGCRRAVATWQASGEPLLSDGRRWTVADAREFVREIVALFQAYNRTLWQQFSYCRSCRGGCCEVGASEVTLFDAIALALLELSLPQRPARLAQGERACIYLTPQGCSWPAQWRPLKCWAFYCLGSGDWQLDAADARYAQITAALQEVVRSNLPALLRRYEAAGHDPLHTFLVDPIGFADVLGAALYDLFVAPFLDRHPALAPFAYDAGDGRARAENDRDATLLFLAEAAAQAWDAPPPAPAGMAVSAGRLLADLEALQWIVAGKPESGPQEVAEMIRRYRDAPPPAPGESASIWYRMYRHLLALQQQETGEG